MFKRLLFTFTLGLLAFSHVHGQTFPTKPIELIVPIAAGGGMDIQTRLLADLVKGDLNQTLTVVNKAGAGGTIGIGQLVKARPDGYTLAAVWNGPLTASPHNQPVTYQLDDYIPVIQFSKAPFVLCVRPEFEADTGADFIAQLKSAPNRYSYGTEGLGGSLHLGLERIFKVLGVRVQAVPFSGATVTVSNFLGGHISIYAGGIASILPHMKAGRAKCLLLTSASNNPVFPQATGLEGLGMAAYEMLTWRVLVAPKGTSTDVIKRLEQAFLRAVTDRRFTDYLKEQGETSAMLTGEALRLYIDQEYAVLGEVQKELSADARPQ